jgi:hypothetical protein
MGGLHHGYLLPHEGNNIGYAFFSFPSLADYEIIGTKFRTHQDVLKHLSMLTIQNASSVTNEIF